MMRTAIRRLNLRANVADKRAVRSDGNAKGMNIIENRATITTNATTEAKMVMPGIAPIDG